MYSRISYNVEPFQVSIVEDVSEQGQTIENIYYPPPTHKVGGGYRNWFRTSVRHISFPELNHKSPQDIFTKFGSHIKQVVNWCLLIFRDFPQKKLSLSMETSWVLRNN